MVLEFIYYLHKEASVFFSHLPEMLALWLIMGTILFILVTVLHGDCGIHPVKSVMLSVLLSGFFVFEQVWSECFRNGTVLQKTLPLDLMLVSVFLIRAVRFLLDRRRIQLERSNHEEREG